ncbi:T6SS effector BTH_I2691 family protein [Pseudomonas sp. KCJK9111]|uniref:T6SS effector BTH_I2691 family protein n=1 Tax=Pseudomonas sp. KCJK9111 TaxID=3344555 RepID=UPI0039058795
MYGWKETFEQCAENRSQLEQLFSPGPAVSCTRTFAILPLRYGVVCGSAAQRRALPELPPHLCRPHQVGELSEASYAIRPLREGFLYVLIKRASTGQYAWHSQYRISPLGTLDFIDPDKPWDTLASLNPLEAIRSMTWLFKIHDLDDVQDLRLLYSPDPLTQDTLRKYRILQLYRDTLASIDIASCASETPSEALPHVLTYERLDLIADFAAQHQGALKTLIQAQPFNGANVPVMAARAEMMPTANKPQHRGVAIVADDAIGITQELNAWRNASLEPLDAFMQRTDAEGLDNQRKFTIAFAIENIRKALAEQAEHSYTQHQNTLGVTYTSSEYSQNNAQVVMMSRGNMRSFRNPEHQQQVQQAEIRQARERSWEDYAPYIDEGMRQDYLRDYRAVVEAVDQARDARAADHLLWLQSEALLDALARYDRNDLEQGLLFETQMAKAIVGMNATRVGDALLTRWSEQGISNDNLVWRSLAQNQESAEDELNTLFGERTGLMLGLLDEAQLQERLKGLTDIYTASLALVEELAAVTTSGPPADRLAGGALLVSTLGSRLFQNRLASALDKPANWLLANALQARLGRFAQHFHLETRGGTALSQGATRRLDRSTASSFDQALRAGIKGPMTEVRIGSLVAVLEVWNLMVKADAADKQSREYIEIAAAMIGVSAAALELGATAAGFAERSGSAAVQQAGKMFRGGLRLGAGTLAGVAASVGAWYDYTDFWENAKNENTSIDYLYFLRATAQTGVASLSLAIGLASSGPFLEYMIKRHGSSAFMSSTLKVGVNTSKFLAARMVFMLRVFFGLNLLTFAITAGLMYFVPNDLQRYLSHSTFRKDRSKGIADTEEKEIEIMQRAVGSTL